MHALLFECPALVNPDASDGMQLDRDQHFSMSIDLAPVVVGVDNVPINQVSLELIQWNAVPKFVAVHLAENCRVTCAGGLAFGIVNGDLQNSAVLVVAVEGGMCGS